MTLLIPQISTGVAESLLAQLAGSSLVDLDPGDELFFSQATTQPTGGLPITDATLKQLRDSILMASRSHGFPERRPTSFLRFELEVAEVLAEWKPLWKSDGLPSGEALRNDCWSFITIVVLPDIALWRWPARSSEENAGGRSWKGRMVGGSRNTFQRIFRRIMCLDRGAGHPDRWGLIRDLQEDDFSAILERPGLSSNRDIALSLGEEYIAMKQRLSQVSAGLRQDVYRQTTKAIRAYGVVQPLDLMSAENRSRLIQDAFQRYEKELTAAPPSELESAASSGSDVQKKATSSKKPALKSLLRRILEGD
ncbi:MAG: hypothetical protein FJY85_00710 [Deltaproteobacteria bacterium]|nr:hypothetical protein [Deltaproteobacteria bacterium]